jgi:hypothetical protein
MNLNLYNLKLTGSMFNLERAVTFPPNIHRVLSRDDPNGINKNSERTRFLLKTIIGGGALLTLYIVVLIIGNSVDHAINQLMDWWPWVTIQTLGFGIQVGIFFHIRDKNKAGKLRGTSSSLAVGGGVSAGSMVACCLHHVTDVLPIVGFSAATLFLIQYQSIFMTLGVLSNIVGLLFMLEMMYNYSDFNLFGTRIRNIISTYDMKRIRNISAYSSALIFVILFSSTLWPVYTNQSSTSKLRARELVNDLNGVTFTIKPVEYDGKKLAFAIKIDTHSGSLSFDMVEVAKLEVSGRVYEPILWEGSPPGGHHRFGMLVFPIPTGENDEMKIIISNVNDIPERVFEWGGVTKAATTGIYTWGSIVVITFSALVLSMRSKRERIEQYESLFDTEYKKYKDTIS